MIIGVGGDKTRMCDEIGNSNTRGFEPVKQSGVMILDPAGKLKLARWRLQGDGHGVYYIQDLSMIEALIEKGEVNVVLLNVSGASDIDVFKRIGSISGHFGIIAVVGGNSAAIKKTLSSMGISNTLSRPIDYPELSAAVRTELKNIEERKEKKGAFERIKKAITNHRTLYRTVLEHTKTAVLVVDSKGKVTFINRPMASLLQWSEGGFLGKHFSEVTGSSGSHFQLSLLGLLQKTLETQEASFTDIVMANGTEEPAPFETKAHPVFDEKGEFVGAFLTVVDVFNPRKLEKVMVQSEKLAMVGQLAAGAAHEIRNPLTSVRGFIQLLQNELAGTPKAEYINIIIDEIDRVNIIINEFLKLAKPALPNRKPYNLKELWEDIRLLIESEAFLKNIRIIEEFNETLQLVLIDCEQIKQVLINVIRNSFDAMVKSGTLTVRAYDIPGEQKVCLEINDTGIGMDEETVRRMYIPFFTTKDNGTGLGLAVSSTIMESHGAYMEVKSQLARGTTTYLYFPYE